MSMDERGWREPVQIQVQCEVCNGTGVCDEIWHQDEKGNSEKELIRCDNCNGDGWYVGYE